MQTLQSYPERNTSFVVKKSGSWRPAGLLEHPWDFLNQLFGGGPKEVYADFFGILTLVEYATDERLEGS